MHEMSGFVEDGYNLLQNEKFNEFGNLLHENWKLKKINLTRYIKY